MAQARFEVRFNLAPLPEEAWTERGIDQGEFFLSPNPGRISAPGADRLGRGAVTSHAGAEDDVYRRHRAQDPDL